MNVVSIYIHVYNRNKKVRLQQRVIRENREKSPSISRSRALHSGAQGGWQNSVDNGIEERGEYVPRII